MITPILKDPKPHGGTLYTFPSASRDLTRAFTNSEYEFAFSHFACLNLPDFRYGNFKDGDLKGMYLDDLCPDSIANSNYNLNRCLKWHLQSYVMNYEVAILNGFSLDKKAYDYDVLKTPSERIFFNWLQKVNAIKFADDSNVSAIETLSNYGNGLDPNEFGYGKFDSITQLEAEGNKNISYLIGNKLYSWKGGEWKGRVLVSKTVQYIGTIDMINNVNIDGDTFNEIYLNIPAGVGGSSDVYFDIVFDENNYVKGEIIDVDNDEYCEEKEYIIGRDPGSLSMSDKTLEAIYDTFEGYSDKDSGHSYKIDSGYCINFNDSRYTGYSSIEDMNLKSEEDFEFNCVLIYYRIKKDNQWFTNLYGVLFLEEVTISDYDTTNNRPDEDELAGYIQRYPKFKKGNSWGLKLDLKIDAQPDSQLELRDKLYDDPNDSGAGMQMFTEALMQLNDCAKLFYDVKKENTDIEERLYKLENMVSGIDSVYDLRDAVGELRTRVEMIQPSIYSLEGRMDSVENKVASLESNFGYLIEVLKNIDETNIRLGSRISTLEKSFKEFEGDSDK